MAGDWALPIQPRRQKEKTSAAAIAAVAVSVPGGTAGCAGAAAGAGRVFEARADRGSSPWAHGVKREGERKRAAAEKSTLWGVCRRRRDGKDRRRHSPHADAGDHPGDVIADVAGVQGFRVTGAKHTSG